MQLLRRLVLRLHCGRHGLTHDLVGEREDHGAEDTRLRQKKLFDLDRRDPVAPGLDDVLLPAGHEDVAVLVHGRQVPRVEPAVPQHLGRTPGVTIVSGHDVLATGRDLPDLTGADGAPVVPDDLEPDTGDAPPDRTHLCLQLGRGEVREAGGRLGRTVHHVELLVGEGIGDLPDVPFGQGSAGLCEVTEVGECFVQERRLSDQDLVGARDAGKACALVALEVADHGPEKDMVREDHASADPEVGVEQGGAEAVEEREDDRDPVVRIEVEVLDDRGGVRDEVPVGQHDPLLRAGAPGGEDDHGEGIVRKTGVHAPARPLAGTRERGRDHLESHGDPRPVPLVDEDGPDRTRRDDLRELLRRDPRLDQQGHVPALDDREVRDDEEETVVGEQEDLVPRAVSFEKVVRERLDTVEEGGM